VPVVAASAAVIGAPSPTQENGLRRVG